MSSRQAEFSPVPPDRAARRAQGGKAVGVVFAALAIVYTIALVLRAGSWTRFTPLEAATAVAFGAVLIMISVWARGAHVVFGERVDQASPDKTGKACRACDPEHEHREHEVTRAIGKRRRAVRNG